MEILALIKSVQVLLLTARGRGFPSTISVEDRWLHVTLTCWAKLFGTSRVACLYWLKQLCITPEKHSDLFMLACKELNSILLLIFLDMLAVSFATAFYSPMLLLQNRSFIQSQLLETLCWEYQWATSKIFAIGVKVRKKKSNCELAKS